MWLVNLAFSAAVLFYGANIPVRFAFTFRQGDGSALKLGVGLFHARYIFEPQITLSSFRQKADRKWGGAAARTAGKTFRYLLMRARSEGMRLSLRIGAGDAAHTALLWGVVTATCDALCVPARIEPDFAAQRLAVNGSGIVWLRLGHIICAAWMVAMDLIKER